MRKCFHQQEWHLYQLMTLTPSGHFQRRENPWNEVDSDPVTYLRNVGKCELFKDETTSSLERCLRSHANALKKCKWNKDAPTSVEFPQSALLTSSNVEHSTRISTNKTYNSYTFKQLLKAQFVAVAASSFIWRLIKTLKYPFHSSCIIFFSLRNHIIARRVIFAVFQGALKYILGVPCKCRVLRL